jgi:hypothetical protein
MAGWPCGQRARPKREVLQTERPTRRGNGTNGARGRPWGQFFGRSSPSRPNSTDAPGTRLGSGASHNLDGPRAPP